MKLQRSFFFSFLLGTFFVLASFASTAQVHSPRHIAITGNTGGFYEYLPQGYNPNGSETYPLLIHVHGVGELGNGTSDLSRLLGLGITGVINQGRFPTSVTVNGQTHKFIVLSPQFRQWPSSDDLNAVINYAVQNYKVNQARIYLAGLSMGGGVVWEYAGANPTFANRVAAIAPSCGASWPDIGRARMIASANLAVWATHNSGDGTVPVSYTNDYVSNINIAPAPNPQAKKTIFNVGGHDSWTQAYNPDFRENGMNVYEWMLQYQRGSSPAVTYQPVPGRVEAESVSGQNGIQFEISSDAGGGYNLGYIDQNDWMDYQINAASSGSYTISFRVATAVANAQFQVRNASGSTLATVNIPNTGGWQSWQTVTATVSLPAGQQTLRIVSSAVAGWNFNWMDFVQGDTAPAPAPAPAPSVTYQALPGKVEAENYVAMSGVQKENTGDAGGGQNVGYIDQNDWMDYNVNPSAAGTYTVAVRVASQMTGGQLQVRSSNGTVLATINLPNTGGWQTWQTATATLTLPAGNQTLRVVSSSSASWNINWIEYTAGATQPAPTPSYQALPGKVEAEAYVAMSGVQKEGTADAGGGENVGYIDQNDWMDYNVNPSAAGTYTLSVRVASQMTGGQLQIRNASGTVLATVNLPNTGGWQTWQTATATINLAAGNQTLRIVSSSSASWNINWINFAQGATEPAPTPAPSTTFKVEAENYTAMSGVQKENTADAGGGQNVGWIDQNDWMDYSISPSTAGTYTVAFRVASQMNGAQLQVRSSNGTVLATVNLPNTNNWQGWQTVTASVNLPAGTQTIRILSSSAASWNINWMEFSLQGSTTPSSSPIRIESEHFTTMSGVQTEGTGDAGGGQNVGWIDNGDWMDYSVNVPATGAYTVSFRVASQMSGAQLQLRASNGSILATVNVPNTGGWQSWQTVTASVSLSAGAQTLRIHSSSSASWNINWWELASGGASVRTAELAAETVETTAETPSLSLYPNPVTDRVVVSLTNPYQGSLRVEVLSLQGVVVKSFSLQKTAEGTQQFYLSVGELTTGTYILRTTMAEDTKTTQLIKQ